MTQSYRLKFTRVNALKATVSTRIPAQVVGGSGIAVTSANGTYTFDFSPSEFDIATTLTDGLEDTTYFNAWESLSGAFSRISASDIKADIEAGLSFQPLDSELTAVAGLTSATDRLPYFTGAGTASLATFTAFGRTVVDDADATAGRVTLGVVIGTDVAAQSHVGAGGAAHADAIAAGAAGFLTGADKTKVDGVAAGATANSTDAFLLARANHTGTQTFATLTSIPTTLAGYTISDAAPSSHVGAGGTAHANAIAAGAAGFMTGADKTKIDGVAAGATANSTDAFLLARANHSGTQLAATVSDFSEAVDDRVGALLVQGTNIVLTYNDGANTLTVAATGGTGDVVGPGSATDNAAARFDTTSGKLVQNSALLVTDTTGALSRSGGGGIPVEATNTNDSAAAGYVGQVISSEIVFGSAVALTTGTPANITSISLTAGDWDVFVCAYWQPAATTSITRLTASMSQVSATVDNTTAGAFQVFSTAANVMAQFFGWGATGPLRISTASTITLYFVAQATFTVSTLSCYGLLRARRMR